MASGTRKTAPAQLAADHPVEIAMRHQRGDAGPVRPRDQDIGGLGGALPGAARILDPRMKTRMPQDARHHRPFGNPHGEQRKGGRGQRRFGEQRIGDQLGAGRQRGGALPAARAVTGENMVQFPHQVAQFIGRQIGRRQPGFFIGIDIGGEARMAGARTQFDVRLAMPDQENTHR
jgi:hypothetical protein